MGLDMYLYARITAPQGSDTARLIQPTTVGREDYEWGYVPGWDFVEPDPLYPQLIEATGITPIKESPSFSLESDGEGGYLVDATIYYWRKVNAVHQWFVEHTQNGVDECQATVIDAELLMQLVSWCEQVAADHARGPELLPTTSGFFFGSTEYDEWYYEDIARTGSDLRQLISTFATRPGEVAFVYRSSW